MTTDQIKNKINAYLRQFKENSGTFKSFEIVFNYINFLQTEPYLKGIMDDIFVYIEKQNEIMMGIIKNDPEQAEKMNNLVFDPLNPKDIPDMPIFNKEITSHKNALEKNENLPLITNLSIYLTCLLVIADSFQEIKECHKQGDIERVNELIKIIKEESQAICTMPIKNNKPMIVMSSQYMAMCVEMVNKYIRDEIDSQDFSITFDKEKSVLFIRGEKILITRKNSKTLDHYILEAIFSKDDLTEQADFVEISEDFLGDDYDSQKGWNRFRHACDRLNEKVDEDTNGQYKKFVEYSACKTGWCKINPKYI